MNFKTLALPLLTSILLSAGSQITAQKSGWELFKEVDFKNTLIKEYGMFVPWPDFTDEIKKWEGKEVILAGYIIPTADAAGFEGIIISKFPYSMCFFCGEAGIESVAELRLKDKAPDFELDKPYVFKGKLKLNDEDFEQLNFILLDAELTDL